MVPKTYSQELRSLGYGYPLRQPEPTGDVSIGDVGFLHNGAFLRLFNVATDWDGIAKEYVVGFEPLTIGPCTTSTLKSGIYTSRSVTQTPVVGGQIG